MNILIIDDHPLTRLGAKHTLGKIFHRANIVEAANAPEAQQKWREAKEPWDLILMDINLGRGDDGIVLCQEFCRDQHKAPILICSLYPEGPLAVQAIKAGARGYYQKNQSAEKLVEAARKVANGGRAISEDLAEAVLDDQRAGKPKLSGRELMVLRRITEGDRLIDIAKGINKSREAVQSYRNRLCEKIGAQTDREIVAYAWKEGFAV